MRAGLNPTPVARHVRLVPASLDDLVTRVRAELKDAAAARRPFAVGVARHSMGGQSLPRDGTALTLAGEADRASTPPIALIGPAPAWAGPRSSAPSIRADFPRR